MSWIRPTSNPEGLYAFSPDCATLDIYIDNEYMTGEDCDGSMLGVPIDDLLEAADRLFVEQDVTVNDLKVQKDVCVYEDTWEEASLSVDQILTDMKSRLEGTPYRKTRYAIKVTYKNKSIYLWKVTWNYMIGSRASMIGDSPQTNEV